MRKIIAIFSLLFAWLCANGALLDAVLLAEVYVELIGARQAMLGLAQESNGSDGRRTVVSVSVRTVELPPRVTEAERDAHRSFIATLGEKALWREYQPGQPE